MQDDNTNRTTSFYNPQQQRESNTGISVDRHYDIGYNGSQEGIIIINMKLIILLRTMFIFNIFYCHITIVNDEYC